MAFGDRFGSKQELALHFGSFPFVAGCVAEPDILTKTAPEAGPALKILFRLLACLPLPLNHAVGAMAGRLAFALSPRYRRQLLENLAASGLCSPDDVRRVAWENAAEIGKGVSELAWALFRSDDAVARVRSRGGWEAVERLRAAKRPIVFVTPHLGSYDIAGRYLWQNGLQILAMYRPHKVFWIDQLLREGRNRGAAPDGTNVAPASLAGVRMVLKHLRRGGCTVVLPDQVPGLGEGEWVDFFGRPAYTMTLLGRLQHATGAAVVFCYAERLGGSDGFHLHLEELTKPLSTDRREAARQVNAEVERLVRSCPAQYLWGYNRYKHPAGAPLPPRGSSARAG
jgi:KDO2-lipid IV(A) lauroyltransferase